MAGLLVRSTVSDRRRPFVRVGWMLLGAMMLLPCAGQPLLAQSTHDLAGTWQGTLDMGNSMRIVLKLSKSDSGGWKGIIFNIDQSPYGTGVESIALQGSALKFSVPAINASYEGTCSADGSSIQGTLTLQGHSLPLNLVRATADTAWAIPEPPRSMAANAKPKFDVVTIKPSSPESQGKTIAGVKGRHYLMANTSLSDIAAFAYSVDAKQILGGPAWFDSSPYDVDGVPDVEGQPSMQQLREPFQALLTDRFKLAFHREKRELPAYAIVLSKSGSRLTKSASAATDPPSFESSNGTLKVTNETMAEISDKFQYVVQRPVVDRTGLAGRFDLRLTWTPDDSPSTDPNAAPGLFTAIQEQLGLKLESVKAPVDVIVIDHVERPSAN